jgi:SMP-30/Gluconolactonase/LRE-like region
MRFVSRVLIAVLVVAFLAPPAHAWFRTPATRFATLPPGAAHPEGITADAHSNIYVTTFAVAGTSSGVGQIFVFNKHGRLIREVNVAGSSTFLLDLAFHPHSGVLLVLDFGASKVLSVDPVSGASTVFSDISAGGQPGLNVLTFNRDGNVYVSASFAGAIYKIAPGGGPAATWVQSDLLTTTGVPGFGANGLAFNRAQTTLFVNNTGNDTVVKIPVNGNGTAGTPAVFVNAVNGADGLIVDDHDTLWIAANQADEIVVIDPSGRTIAKLGDFNGLDRDGAPLGLLFPASLVFSGPFVYVTNLASDLRLFGAANATGDSPWTADVKVHTISRIPAFIPPIHGLPRH